MGKPYLTQAAQRRNTFSPATAYGFELSPKNWVGKAARLGPLDRRGVRSCLEILPGGVAGTLFGFFVDDEMKLLAFEQIAAGPINRLRPGIGRLLQLGRTFDATAVILAYPAMTDDLQLDTSTLQFVAGMRSCLGEFDLPLLDYLVIGPERTFGIGSW